MEELVCVGCSQLELRFSDYHWQNVHGKAGFVIKWNSSCSLHAPISWKQDTCLIHHARHHVLKRSSARDLCVLSAQG